MHPGTYATTTAEFRSRLGYMDGDPYRTCFVLGYEPALGCLRVWWLDAYCEGFVREGNLRAFIEQRNARRDYGCPPAHVLEAAGVTASDVGAERGAGKGLQPVSCARPGSTGPRLPTRRGPSQAD